MQNEAFEWMRAVQQTAIPRSILEKQLGHVMELRKVLKGMRNGPSPQRKKAMAVLFLERGIKCSLVRSVLHLSRRSARNYWERYRYGSTIALFAKRMNARRKCEDDRIKQALFSLLHSPPSVHGINRTTWKMSNPQRILREQGHSTSRDLFVSVRLTAFRSAASDVGIKQVIVAAKARSNQNSRQRYASTRGGLFTAGH
jgi:hypothetical protein